MDLKIKNIDYSLAKSILSNNKGGEVKLVTYQVSHNGEEYKTVKYLSLDIIGSVEDIEYPMHFVIDKPVNELLKIEKYENIYLTTDDFMDCYMVIDALADLDLELKGKVARFSNSLVFNLSFNIRKEYYGNLEFQIYLKEVVEK